MSQKKRQIKNMTPSSKSKAHKKTFKEPSTGGLGFEGVSADTDLELINTETHKSKSYVGSISFKSKKFNSVDKSRPSSCTTQTTYSEMSDDQDILILTLSEITQKIVHCQIGQDLFIDIPWCNVKKKDILEDISIQDTNSPFYKIMGKIMAYKHEELLMGYEPLGSEENQFYLCITENGRNEVLQRLEHMRLEFTKKIQASKEIKPKPWKSLGSESEVDLFQVKNTRALISLEWIGEVAKRCHEPVFSDLDADEKNNTYTSLLPKKEKPDLIFMKTQDTGSQAVPTVKDLEVQTVPEIPTNENTQCATEAEIAVVEQENTTEKSQDLNAFFEKNINFLTDILHYNEVYDLYKDDYPALATFAKDAQVQQHSAYRQYQSFTDVAAIEGKLVISSSWHPNYTGIVAVAYANVIPCKTHELEYDSDQADYEEENTDESDKEKNEGEEDTPGNKKWLEEEKAEKETKEENTELYDKAAKKLKDVEATKRVWDVKVMDGTDEIKRETLELDSEPKFEYIEHPVESESQTEQELKHSVDVEIIDIEDNITEEYKKSSDSLVDDRYMDSFLQRSSVSIERGLKSPSIRSEQSAISEASKYGKLATKLTKHKHQIHSTSSRKDKNKQRFQKYLGRDYYSATSLMSRKTSLVSSLAYSSIDTGERFFGDQEKEKFEEVTDDEELKDDEEELPYLEPNNPVLIWSFVDDLTPKLRLDSPYEVTCVEFCPHNGNILAGGTVSGQVVVWDITGRIEELEQPETLTPQQQKHKKVMEYLMDWRRDTRSRRRVRPCVISNYDVSHNDKITSLSWIIPFLEVSRFGEVEPVTSQNGFSLQVVTSGLEGEIKIWDLKSDPLKKSKKQVRRRNDTVERYGRPTSLDKGISPFSKLYRQWNPLLTLKLTHGHASVMLTGVAPTSGLFSRNRVTPPLLGVKETLENRVEYTLGSPKEALNLSRHFFISTAFGHPGNVEWEIMDKEAATASEGPITPSIGLWKTVHDAPITRIVRHPFFSDICLTVGGHMFAIWHQEDREYPIMSKRYYGVRITDGLWSSLRPSLIRIARSDGIVEIWDLLLQSHAPANKIIVSGKIVTNMSGPCLPEVHGLLGIADYNSAFRLFYIPRQFRVYNMDELAQIKEMFNKEPARRRKMREWSKWWRENEVNSDRQMKKRENSQEQSNEEVLPEEEKIKESQKKYKEEVYKWYLMRRGKSYLGTEEAEEKWRYKQEKHMHEVIMQKKKSRSC
uniref:WD repeat-containing protein 63 n=1 Tax=Clastoptera arizonana TaxID=38151 RepID=A0A1B6CBV5_9HEMI